MIHLEEVYSKFQRIINRLSMTSLEKITELENVVDSRDKIIQKAVIDLESEKIKASRLKSENDHFVRFKVKKRASRQRSGVNSWDQARSLFSGLATVNTDTSPRMTRALSTNRAGSQSKSKFQFLNQVITVRKIIIYYFQSHYYVNNCKYSVLCCSYSFQFNSIVPLWESNIKVKINR